MEELYRSTAFAEARKKRDRLAADCVRLGKIVTVRQVSMRAFIRNRNRSSGLT